MEPEAILPHDGARVNNDSLADNHTWVQHRAGMYNRALSDSAFGADDCTWHNDHTLAQDAIRANDRTNTDIDIRTKFHRLLYHGER